MLLLTESGKKRVVVEMNGGTQYFVNNRQSPQSVNVTEKNRLDGEIPLLPILIS